MAEAEKDYLKEQSGAYVDWQKQSNKYGANAEAKAAMGMTNTGYTESSQVAMYNQYQNRVAIAREAYTRATTDFKLGIAEAKAANSVAIAEIKANALAQSLEIAMQFAMQNNSLLTEKARQQTAIRQQNFSNYMDVYGALMQENAIAEDVRQFNAQISEEKRQFNESQRLEREKLAWQKAQAARAASSGGGGSSSNSAKVTKSKAAVDKIVGSKIANDITNGKNVNKTNNTKKSSDPEINRNSLSAAGIPQSYSGETLYNMVDKGELLMLEKNGQIYFYRNDALGRIQYQKQYNK